MPHTCTVRRSGAETRVSERHDTGEARATRLAERMRWRETTDAELVAAVRRGSYEALREFYARFEPLLARYAARAGVRTECWEDDAHDVLGNVVLALVEARGAARARDSVQDIHAYIQRAFRNRFLECEAGSSATRAARRARDVERGCKRRARDARELLRRLPARECRRATHFDRAFCGGRAAGIGAERRALGERAAECSRG